MLCTTEELAESGNVENELIEKGYMNLIDTGSIDLGHKLLQVLASAPELEIIESGENCTCQRGWTSACSIGAGSRG